MFSFAGMGGGGGKAFYIFGSEEGGVQQSQELWQAQNVPDRQRSIAQEGDATVVAQTVVVSRAVPRHVVLDSTARQARQRDVIAGQH